MTFMNSEWLTVPSFSGAMFVFGEQCTSCDVAAAVQEFSFIAGSVRWSCARLPDKVPDSVACSECRLCTAAVVVGLELKN